MATWYRECTLSWTPDLRAHTHTMVSVVLWNNLTTIWLRRLTLRFPCQKMCKNMRELRRLNAGFPGNSRREFYPKSYSQACTRARKAGIAGIFACKCRESRTQDSWATSLLLEINCQEQILNLSLYLSPYACKAGSTLYHPQSMSCISA
jgi:hypothetical protein